MTSPTRPGNRWLVLIAMTGALSMIMLDQTVVTVALPSMGHDLPLSSMGQQWVVNAYVLAMAALVALGGKLGDRLGGVTTFRVGVAVFFLASLACGLAPDGDAGQAWIIVARVIQGAGAALMIPVSASIVVNAFDVAARGRAMAVYAGISQVFLAVGPLLGGLLTEAVSWRTVFLLNIPVGVAALVMVHIARPVDIKQPEVAIRGRSVAQLVTGIGLTALGVQQAGVWGWGSPLTAATIAAGLALTAWFARTQLRTAAPLVQVRLFAQRGFLANMIVLTLVQFGLLAVILYSSLNLQNQLQLSPVASGLGVLPLIVSLAAAAQLGGRWYDRAGVRPPALTGLLVAATGLALWALALPALTYVWQVPGMLLTGLGLGLIMSPTNTDALGRVDMADRSQASGLIQTLRQLGGTLGIAVIGAVVLGVSHHGSRQNSLHHAADATATGFIVAAVAFGAALLAGWVLLPHERLVETGNDEAVARELAAAL